MLIRLKNDDFFIEIDPSKINFDDVINMLEKYSFKSKLILTLINTDHFIRHNRVFTFESIKDLKEFKELKDFIKVFKLLPFEHAFRTCDKN